MGRMRNQTSVGNTRTRFQPTPRLAHRATVEERDAHRCSSLSMTVSVVVVDLGALQRSGVVHVADFRLRVEVIHLPAALTMAVPGLLHSTVREMGLRADRWCIDVGDAVVELV